MPAASFFVQCSALRAAKEHAGMKFWLIGITAALSLIAMAPDYGVSQAARAATVQAASR